MNKRVWVRCAMTARRLWWTITCLLQVLTVKFPWRVVSLTLLCWRCSHVMSGCSTKHLYSSSKLFWANSLTGGSFSFRCAVPVNMRVRVNAACDCCPRITLCYKRRACKNACLLVFLGLFGTSSMTRRRPSDWRTTCGWWTTRCGPVVSWTRVRREWSVRSSVTSRDSKRDAASTTSSQVSDQGRLIYWRTHGLVERYWT